MDVFDRIIEDNSWRFKNGYPDMDDPEDKGLLFEIVNGYLNEEDLEVSPEIEDLEVEDDENNKNNKTVKNSGVLENIITTKYAVDGQEIYNIDSFYNRIAKSSNSDKLFKLIIEGGKEKLSSGKKNIQGLDKELFDLVMATIKIPNGEPSELWFAIMYKGEVKGGVAGDTGITSDIDVNGVGVSLKNYNSLAVIDFGNLGKTVEGLLRDTINLFQILSGGRVTKTLTRNSINGILDLISTPEVESDLKEIMDMAETTKIQTIQRLGTQIQNSLEGGDTKSLARKFCRGIDINIADKLNEVKWWVTINKGTVYTESNDELYQKLKCKDDRLSEGVTTFKDLHLFVNGNYIFKEITK